MADVITHYITAERFIKAHPDVSPQFARGLRFGSQGPDIFFFGATRRSYIFSCSIHDGDPSALFAGLAGDIAGETELYRGYALGVLLHYFLDMTIHPYVGQHCAADPRPYEHVFFESAIEMAVFCREYGFEIKDFNYDAAFVRGRDIAPVMLRFWNRRLSQDVNDGYIRRCLFNMRYLTKMFMRAKAGTVRAARFAGRLIRNPAAAMAHFKTGFDESVMNDARAPWDSPDGTMYDSVEDMLDIALERFTRAYDAIGAGTYSFLYKKPFSYGS